MGVHKKMKKGVLAMHKSINSSKYNKVEFTKEPPKPETLYKIYRNGWRKIEQKRGKKDV